MEPKTITIKEMTEGAPRGEYYLYFDLAKALSVTTEASTAKVVLNGSACEQSAVSPDFTDIDNRPADTLFLQKLAASAVATYADVELREGRNELSISADEADSPSSLHVARLFIHNSATASHSELVVRINARNPLLLETVILADVDKKTDVIMIQADKSSLLLTTTNVVSRRNSRLTFNLVNLSPSCNRNEVTASLVGENASVSLGGLYSAVKDCKVDNVTTVRHLVPNCESQQLFKGIADDNGNISFSGLIVVKPNAQKTTASQTNRHCISDKSAKAYSKPQLEIYADDVKCSHGATTGQIDESQLFYMQQRGIDESEARKLLTAAFLSEVADKFPMRDVRDEVLSLITGMDNDINEEV